MKTTKTWTVTLDMTLGTERTTVSRSVDLAGDAREVITAMNEIADEVSGAVREAAQSILVSARGFGVRRDGK